jgi:SAM-dependent methyltransferase
MVDFADHRVPTNRRMRRADRRGKKSSASPKQTTADHDFIGNFIEHGWHLLTSGRDQEAMEIAKRAILIEETDATRALFAECIKGWSYFPGAEEIRDVLARALTERWATFLEHGKFALGLLKRDPAISHAIERVRAVWPRRPPMSELFGAPGLSAVSNNSLLLAVLKVDKNFDIELELLLTSIRAALLELSCRDDATFNEQTVDFCCALARQCFINEYIFDIAPAEENNLTILRRLIVDQADDVDRIYARRLAVFGCYHPLDSLPENRHLLKRRWPKSFDDVLTLQLREPVAVQDIRSSIPQVTPITNETSSEVRAQYEDNPYPRWVGLPAKTSTLTFDESVRQSFPASSYRPIQKNTFDMLIAGCGTGQHSVVLSQSFPHARILAIDLSLQSLAYAKQKTQEMGINNIEYAQADILELHRLGRAFDVVSSSGVLHHLRSPEDGWSKLLALVRPNGCMHIGLYSERARTSVVAAQNWLQANGYSFSNIRSARQALVGLAMTQPLFKDVFDFRDFYSRGECRDLLFHVQEVNFSMDRIKAFLSENSLQFLGFVINDYSRNLFAKTFSRQEEANLDLWDGFEAANPKTFAGMYQFWLQKI